tara:strand:+ start:3875 stop:4027 length:153 start_codon:yes stop_codon:yes gene_type:complete
MAAEAGLAARRESLEQLRVEDSAIGSSSHEEMAEPWRRTSAIFGAFSSKW